MMRSFTSPNACCRQAAQQEASLFSIVKRSFADYDLNTRTKPHLNVGTIGHVDHGKVRAAHHRAGAGPTLRTLHLPRTVCSSGARVHPSSLRRSDL